MSIKYYIYILTDKTNSRLYTGMTTNLRRRITELKQKSIKDYASRYNLNKLVFYDAFDNPVSALESKWQIRHSSIKKKSALIEKMNKKWKDLSEEI
ncbi:MAG: GIY-YIG nuclease family protein [Ignavibacteria bacterium]|jgi:putative endonuclease